MDVNISFGVPYTENLGYLENTLYHDAARLQLAG